MIPKTYSKIFTISIFSLLATSAAIPITYASDEAPLDRGKISKTRTEPASQPLTTSPVLAIPMRRAVSAPASSVNRSKLLTDEPKPGRSIMIRRPSLMQPPREGEKDVSAAEYLISQPIAGFIPLSGHQSSQFDDSNAVEAMARLDIDIMKSRILPTVEELLAHTWYNQPAPIIDIKDDLLAIVGQLKAGNPHQASVLSAALIKKVNAAEAAGPLDEFSRLNLYSVQTILHLLAGTPYIALNNFLELRQLGISWHSHSDLISDLFNNPGSFYHHLSDFVSSGKATSIWAEDDRIRKLWQGHSQFAWDQNAYEKISDLLGGLGDTAGTEGELTFRHTLYVLGKMQLRFGEHLRDDSADPLLAASEQTLRKIDGYRFEGLFSYRNVATKVFLGDVAWSRSKLGGSVDYLTQALTCYTDAVPLIEKENETGATMIRSSFDHSKDVIKAYGALPAAVASNETKMAKFVLFNERLISLHSDSLPHINIPMLKKTVSDEFEKLIIPESAAATSSDVAAVTQKKGKKSEKKRKGDDFEESQRDDGWGGFYDEYQRPPASAKKKK